MEWLKKSMAMLAALGALSFGSGFMVGCEPADDEPDFELEDDLGDDMDDAGDEIEDGWDETVDEADDAMDDDM